MTTEELKASLQGSLANAYANAIRLNKGEPVDVHAICRQISIANCAATELQNKVRKGEKI